MWKFLVGLVDGRSGRVEESFHKFGEDVYSILLMFEELPSKRLNPHSDKGSVDGFSVHVLLRALSLQR